MKPAFVFCSDSHLEPLTYVTMEDMRYDAFLGFSQAIDKTVKYDTDIVFGGDNTENNPRDYPGPETINFLGRQLDRLEKKGLKAYYVNGQHDRTRNGYDWMQATNPRVAIPLHMRRETIRGISLVGLNSVFYHELDDHVKSLDDNLIQQDDVFVCHQRWAEFLRFEGAADGRLKDLPPKLRTVITGDYHGRKVLKIKKNGKDLFRVISPGATCRRAKAEPDEHFVWTYRTDHTAISSKIASRPVLRLRVDDVHDVDQLADTRKAKLAKLQHQGEKLPIEIRKPLVYIDGEGSPDLMEAASRLFTTYCHVRITSSRRVSVTQTTQDWQPRRGKVDVCDFVPKVCADSDMVDFLSQGLRTQDPQTFVANWRKQQGLT